MKLRLRLVTENSKQGYFKMLEISHMLTPGVSRLIYLAIINDEIYGLLKPYEGTLYSEDSPGLLKNWVNGKGGKK